MCYSAQIWADCRKYEWMYRAARTGHSAYEVASGDERPLYIGGAAHHSIVSVQRPEWTIQHDGDAPKAQASRRALYKRAADGNLRVYAAHFPFPDLGRIKAESETSSRLPAAEPASRACAADSTIRQSPHEHPPLPFARH